MFKRLSANQKVSFVNKITGEYCDHLLLSHECCHVMQITFLGTLYVTDKHTCFSAPSEQISFCLAHEDITEVRKVIAKTRKPGR